MKSYKIAITLFLILLFSINSNTKNKTSITSVKAKLALRVKFDKRPDIYNNFGIIDSNTFLFVDKCIRIYKNNSPAKIIELERKLQYPDYFDYNYLDSLIVIKKRDTLYLLNLRGEIKTTNINDYGRFKLQNSLIINENVDTFNIWERNIFKCFITDSNIQKTGYEIPNIVTDYNVLSFFINNYFYEFDLQNCKLIRKQLLPLNNHYTYIGKNNNFKIFQELGNNFEIIINLTDENFKIIKSMNFPNLNARLLNSFQEGELEDDTIEYDWLGGVFIKYEPKLNLLFFFLNTWQGIEVYKYKLD